MPVILILRNKKKVLDEIKRNRNKYREYKGTAFIRRKILRMKANPTFQ
jgi:hypothetical protein